MKQLKLLYNLLCLCLLISCNSGQSIQLANLKTEMQVNPEGIGTTTPRFSWQIKTNEANIIQSAYQIELAATENDLNSGNGLLWDSGEVTSDNSILIPYNGKQLQSGKEYFWRLKVKTNTGESFWSSIQKFSTALLNNTSWNASWIGINDSSSLVIKDNRTRLPARYLRKEFKTSGKVKRAMLYISGLGSNVCYINGTRVSDDVFAPLPTLYTKTVYYNTYNITNLIKNSQNAIGVTLGNGRYLSMRQHGMVGFGLPRLIARLDIEYDNGQTESIVTDNSWEATEKGPIIQNNEFDGEEYDARLEMDGWNNTGYNASAWQKADIMTEPGGELIAQPAPNIKVMEEIKPISIKAVADGKYILDMGQNMVGWVHFKLKGKKDKPVTFRFAELLKNGNNELYMDNLRSALVTDIYTPAKDGQFAWEPIFVYHGFRFVEISGLDYEPALTDFIGKVIYDEMPTIGSFETSNPLINRIYKNSYWGIRGNYRGMPTDCPQRDERLGWLGDRTTGAHSESFIFGNSLLYNKWMKDIEDSMNEAGSISVVSPRYWTIYNDDVTWPAAYFYISEMLYKQFGDIQSIKKHYPSMKKWLNHMTSNHMQDYIIQRDTYGDWCMPPERQELIHSQDPSRKTDGRVLSTTVFYSILQLMEKFAIINGSPEDAQSYKDLAARMKESYNIEFFNPETAQYSNNTVTANMLSLQLGLVPEGYEDRVMTSIVDKTNKDFNGHVSAGVLGIQHLMRGLTQHGNLDLAYKIVTNETYPSWGYMVKNDATTIWELWNGDTADPAMNSANHVMLLGDLIIWFYENLAGIQNDPEAVAFKKIRMKPSFPDGLNEVKASYECPYGLIESAWKRNGNSLNWNITIPANTTATIEIPTRFNIDTATLQNANNIKEQDGNTIINLGSGKYILTSKR